MHVEKSDVPVWGRTTRLVGLSLIAMGLMLPGVRLWADGGDATDDPVRIIDGATLEVDNAALGNLSVTTVTQQDFPDVLGIMGAVSPIENRVTSVPARTAGRIDSVLKVTGEYVRAGEALALEYSPDYIQTRQEYLDALHSGFSDLASSSRKKLANMGLIPGDIDGLGKPGDDPIHLVVRASRAGAITAMNTSVGNMQNQGDTLMTITDLDRVWFTGDLYSVDLGKVHPGQRIQVEAGGLNQSLGGVISFISPVIDLNAHTIKVRAVIENPDRVLRAGMVVEGDVVLGLEPPALVVPTTALMNLHNRLYCFKKIQAGRFREVPVTVGREYGGHAVVLDGLKQGDQIVSEGALVLDYAFQGD